MYWTPGNTHILLYVNIHYVTTKSEVNEKVSDATVANDSNDDNNNNGSQSGSIGSSGTNNEGTISTSSKKPSSSNFPQTGAIVGSGIVVLLGLHL